MTERDRDSLRRCSTGDRTVGRRTILGVSLAGLAGAGFAGTAVSQDGTLPNELVIVSQTNLVEYTIEVDGRIEFGDSAGDRDEIESGTTVTGAIDGAGQDNYHFAGEITAFEITEGADATRVVLNGQEVDPEDLGDGDVDETRDRDEDLPYEITLRPTTDDVEYELAVDGTLDHAERSGAGQPEIEEDFRVSGTLEGDDEHAFRFWGIALVLEIPEGTAAFSVELEDDGSTGPDRLPHRLLVFGLEDAVEYRFTVSETVEFGAAAETEDTEIPADERVDDRTVEGHVHAHDGDPLTDDYRFDGSIDFERAEGPVRIRLKPNDEREEDSGE